MKSNGRGFRFYANGIPDVDVTSLQGRLIVLEGSDGSGRSTQIAHLTEWLEKEGHAVTSMGLKRSTLVSEELDEAKKGNVLSRTTMSLFYATDFADQLENRLIPALRAGFIVLADRYIYTLMARDLVRGANRKWLESMYGIALVPDAVFYLKVSPELLVDRLFQKYSTLDYWESGMDLGFSRDMYESFMQYQKLIQDEFKMMEECYQFKVIDGNRTSNEVAEDLRTQVATILQH